MSKLDDPLELITVAELADLLGVPCGTVYAWRYRGTGPAGIKVGRHLRFLRSDVEAWLDRCRDPQ